MLRWLRFWARWQLKKFAPDIIGITGSAGKTSCRNAVKAVLQDKYQLKVGYKANSESGIPLNILGIKPGDFSQADWLRMCILAPLKLLTNWQPYEKFIVEMGIDSPHPPKNMEYLLTIVQPRTAIFLNALPVHTAFFPPSPRASEGQINSVDLIAREKGKLIRSLPTNGLAILNRDDQRVWKFQHKTRARVMSFGKNPESDVVIETWSPETGGTEFGIRAGTESAKLTLPYLLPEHFGHTLAAALVVALDEDYSLTEGMKLLVNNFKLPPGRASWFKGINGSKILDSSYNASPQTMTDMLDLLSKVEAKRKLALLGDMRELGEESDSEHKKIVNKALKIADQVHLVGLNMYKACAPGAHVWENAKQAGERIKLELKPGDLLLVKGSQNTIFLETAVEKLLADPNDAAELCRRGKEWQKQRP